MTKNRLGDAIVMERYMRDWDEAHRMNRSALDIAMAPRLSDIRGTREGVTIPEGGPILAVHRRLCVFPYSE